MTTYTTRGSVRGGCEHTHKSIAAAQKCLERDQHACKSLGVGGYSDRIIVRTDGAGLSDAEHAEWSKLTD